MLNEVLDIYDLMKALEIDEISALELMNGDTEFEATEIYALARYKGMSMTQLISKLTDALF